MACILIIILILAYFYIENENYKKIFQEYSQIKCFWYPKIKKIDLHKTVKMIESGSGVLYIGRSTCQSCQEKVPYLIEEAKKTKNSIIYYLNTDSEDFRQEQNNQTDIYNKIVKIVPEIPTVLEIKNGKILKNTSEEPIYADKEEDIEVTKKMYDEMFKEVYG